MKSGYGTSPTVSISNFLKFVNSQPLGSSVLSLDVVKNLNSQRTFDENVTPYLLFSEKDQSVYDTMGETERIRKENEKLNADAGKLSEIMGSEEIPNKRFLALANYLKKISGNNADAAILATKLKDVYTSMQKSDSLNWNEVARKTHSIAESIMSRDLDVPVQ